MSVSVDQLKRLANERHVAMRRKDEEIENLRRDLASERERTVAQDKAINQLIEELAAANGALISLHGRIRLIEKLAGADPLIIQECRWCLARIEGER